MRIAVLIVAATVIWPTAAVSVSLEDFSLKNGQALVDLCAVEDGDPLYNEAMSFCFGFFSGAMHFHSALVRGPDVKPMVCPKSPVSRAEAITVFLAWAKANPTLLQDDAIQAALRAAVEEWPCSPADATTSKK